ncbi:MULTISPECIES: hypothetical protein [unclassified Granulicatella]|uniref:hypothetical protein n=1 Tax=unclassified Granulicatella TaxID=2630493 RepID=UPI001073C96B|nr:MULTISPECIES: hypothetical protein [unclassified Granulicatella]MBF0780461.1 hypothetical protein [Granulicatella sp. 19428wC4_WM01]TFU95363.1 hypothetical protein E4T68_05085 [Granulicatella sp. WM01]
MKKNSQFQLIDKLSWYQVKLRLGKIFPLLLQIIDIPTNHEVHVMSLFVGLKFFYVLLVKNTE